MKMEKLPFMKLVENGGITAGGRLCYIIEVKRKFHGNADQEIGAPRQC